MEKNVRWPQVATTIYLEQHVRCVLAQLWWKISFDKPCSLFEECYKSQNFIPSRLNSAGTRADSTETYLDSFSKESSWRWNVRRTKMWLKYVTYRYQNSVEETFADWQRRRRRIKEKNEESINDKDRWSTKQSTETNVDQRWVPDGKKKRNNCKRIITTEESMVSKEFFTIVSSVDDPVGLISQRNSKWTRCKSIARRRWNGFEISSLPTKDLLSSIIWWTVRQVRTTNTFYSSPYSVTFWAHSNQNVRQTGSCGKEKVFVKLVDSTGEWIFSRASSLVRRGGRCCSRTISETKATCVDSAMRTIKIQLEKLLGKSSRRAKRWRRKCRSFRCEVRLLSGEFLSKRKRLHQFSRGQRSKRCDRLVIVGARRAGHSRNFRRFVRSFFFFVADFSFDILVLSAKLRRDEENRWQHRNKQMSVDCLVRAERKNIFSFSSTSSLCPTAFSLPCWATHNCTGNIPFPNRRRSPHLESI